MKNIIKCFAIIYWSIAGLIGIRVVNFCGFECSLINKEIPSFREFLFIAIFLLVLIFGIYLILKFFKLEWYKKWWSIFLYFLIIFYPLFLINIGDSFLCGCVTDF
jgi:hypothetical protein